MHCHEFASRPNAQQVTNALRSAMQAGHPSILVLWGENEIEAIRLPGGYVGCGWIKNISGHDVVESIKKFCLTC